VCDLHILESHCVCNAQSREALFVYCIVYTGTVCVMHNVEGTGCVLHSLEKHFLCTGQSRVALFVYCEV